MIIIAIAVFLFLGGYFFWQKKKQEQRFNRNVGITVSYMIQEHPGQYSGDRNAKSGVFIFRAQRADEKLKNIVIKKVTPLHPSLDVSMEHILVIPFGSEATSSSEASVRFKVVKRGIPIEDLCGVRVSIRGLLNFDHSKTESFVASLLITDLYQMSR